MRLFTNYMMPQQGVDPARAKRQRGEEPGDQSQTSLFLTHAPASSASQAPPSEPKGQGNGKGKGKGKCKGKGQQKWEPLSNGTTSPGRPNSCGQSRHRGLLLPISPASWPASSCDTSSSSKASNRTANYTCIVVKRPSVVSSQSPRHGDRVESPAQGRAGEDHEPTSSGPPTGGAHGDGNSSEVGASEGKASGGGNEVADRDGRVDLHAVECSEGSARAPGGPATTSSRDAPGVSDRASQAGHLRLLKNFASLKGIPQEPQAEWIHFQLELGLRPQGDRMWELLLRSTTAAFIHWGHVFAAIGRDFPGWPVRFSEQWADGRLCACFAWLSNLFQRDTSLTDEGHAQAVCLNEKLISSPQNPLNSLEVVITSPLSRCIQTMLAIFGEGDVPPRCICALHTERCVFPCDTGRSPEALAEAFPAVRGLKGFEELGEQWWPQDRSIMNELHPNDRVEAFKQMLLARPEEKLAVVGHSGFFHILTGRKMHNCEVLWIRLSADLSVDILGSDPGGA
eukprot:s2934_g3.t1